MMSFIEYLLAHLPHMAESTATVAANETSPHFIPINITPTGPICLRREHEQKGLEIVRLNMVWYGVVWYVDTRELQKRKLLVLLTSQ